MSIKSRVLFENAHYVACLVCNGNMLTVQHQRSGCGVSMVATHPQFADYVDGLGDNCHRAEQAALCKALLA